MCELSSKLSSYTHFFIAATFCRRIFAHFFAAATFCMRIFAWEFLHGIRKFAWRACLDGACARILPFARFAANCFVCFCVRKFGADFIYYCSKGERLAACGEGERPEEGSPIARRTRSAKNSSRPSWNLCGRMRNANNSRPSQRRAARVAAKGTCVQTLPRNQCLL